MKGPSANKDEGALCRQRNVRVHARHTGSLVRHGQLRRGSRVSFRGWRADMVDREDADSPRFRKLRESSRWRFPTRLHGVAVGGDYMKPDESAGTIAITNDGGKTWSTPQGPSPDGYRSAVWCRDASVCVATGTSGSDYSSDGGQSWKKFGNGRLQRDRRIRGGNQRPHRYFSASRAALEISGSASDARRASAACAEAFLLARRSYTSVSFSAPKAPVAPAEGACDQRVR